VLTNVPGIRVHTGIEAMMWALEEFFLSMLGGNTAVGQDAAWPGAFPQRMLVIDEFGTFAGMAARIHHRTGATGPLPALDQRRQIEWQGRVAGHRLVAVHQPNLRLFGDSDSRASYGYRIITGGYTASLWRMTFGYAPPIEWDARVQGAWRGRHRGSVQPHPPRANRLDARHRTPPLRTHRAAAARLAHQLGPGPVDYASRAGGRTQTCRGIARQHHRQPCARPRCRPCPTRTAGTPAGGNTVRCPYLGHPADPAAAGGGDMITGIAAAAEYLGYDKPDSFRRARTRHPIPGETRAPDGRPAWTPVFLRAWHTQRNAGNHTTGRDPDC
jgi:hypothetical protein